jgi:hypothetical protein
VKAILPKNTRPVYNINLKYFVYGLPFFLNPLFHCLAIDIVNFLFLAYGDLKMMVFLLHGQARWKTLIDDALAVGINLFVGDCETGTLCMSVSKG